MFTREIFLSPKIPLWKPPNLS